MHVITNCNDSNDFWKMVNEKKTSGIKGGTKKRGVCLVDGFINILKDSEAAARFMELVL